MRTSATFKSISWANGSKCPPAFPALKCQIIALSGQIIILDAMGTHTRIAEVIIEKKADCILALKGNQGNLHKEAQDQFHFAIRNLDLTCRDSLLSLA